MAVAINTRSDVENVISGVERIASGQTESVETKKREVSSSETLQLSIEGQTILDTQGRQWEANGVISVVSSEGDSTNFRGPENFKRSKRHQTDESTYENIPQNWEKVGEFYSDTKTHTLSSADTEIENWCEYCGEPPPFFDIPPPPPFFLESKKDFNDQPPVENIPKTRQRVPATPQGTVMVKHSRTKKRSSGDVKTISESSASMGSAAAQGSRAESGEASYIREMIPNRDEDNVVFYKTLVKNEDIIVHSENIGNIGRNRIVSTLTDGAVPQLTVDDLDLKIREPHEAISDLNRNKLNRKVFLSISNGFQNNVSPKRSLGAFFSEITVNDPKMMAELNNAFSDEAERQFPYLSDSEDTAKQQDTGFTHQEPTDPDEFMFYTAQHHLEVGSSRYTSDPMACPSPHVPELACPVIAGSGSAHASSELLPPHAAAVGVALMVTVVMVLAASVLGCRYRRYKCRPPAMEGSVLYEDLPLAVGARTPGYTGVREEAAVRPDKALLELRLLSPSSVAHEVLHSLTTSFNTLSPHRPSHYISPGLTPPASLPNLLRSFTCTGHPKEHLPSHEKKKRFEKGSSDIGPWRCTMQSTELCTGRVHKTGIKVPPPWSTTPHFPTPQLPPPISSIISASELDRVSGYSQGAFNSSNQRCSGHCCLPKIYYITSHSPSKGCPESCSLTIGTSPLEEKARQHQRSIVSPKSLDEIDVQKLGTSMCPGCSNRESPGDPITWTSTFTSYSPNHLTPRGNKRHADLQSGNRSVSTTSLSSNLNLHDTCDYLHFNKDSSRLDKSCKKQKQGEDMERGTTSDQGDRGGAAPTDDTYEGTALSMADSRRTAGSIKDETISAENTNNEGGEEEATQEKESCRSMVPEIEESLYENQGSVRDELSVAFAGQRERVIGSSDGKDRNYEGKDSFCIKSIDLQVGASDYENVPFNAKSESDPYDFSFLNQIPGLSEDLSCYSPEIDDLLYTYPKFPVDDCPEDVTPQKTKRFPTNSVTGLQTKRHHQSKEPHPNKSTDKRKSGDHLGSPCNTLGLCLLTTMDGTSDGRTSTSSSSDQPSDHQRSQKVSVSEDPDYDFVLCSHSGCSASHGLNTPTSCCSTPYTHYEDSRRGCPGEKQRCPDLVGNLENNKDCIEISGGVAKTPNNDSPSISHDKLETGFQRGCKSMSLFNEYKNKPLVFKDLPPRGDLPALPSRSERYKLYFTSDRRKRKGGDT